MYFTGGYTCDSYKRWDYYYLLSFVQLMKIRVVSSVGLLCSLLGILCSVYLSADLPFSTLSNWVIEFERWAPTVPKIIYKVLF